ncbi:acetyl-CoA C-acyltransferase [Profundibacterium mesophilum]|uniref:Acetyl-CoA C-acetyltransferase n=1 Tax=Profundibacterium mesophilum KAUST100406-0324 TaxID=1037889 RepID=A0A921NW94_9RHOB|nr:acetyl-CoA C-acyltransferase [Profundibacterium mesophilum]KAF0675924.1 acetyl-CoA C-acetyltransferase [Profundibacterium mesophilum KAUST100406-0324]
MSRAYIIAARRSPVAPRGGALSGIALHDLGAAAARACLAQVGAAAGMVDDLLAGNALGAGGNPARAIALAAGLPLGAGAMSIDRQCCGGLDAIGIAAMMIETGQADLVLAGGAESYSRRPLRAEQDPDGGPPRFYDQARFTPWPDRDPAMADAAAALAETCGISRGQQEQWARRSHEAALGAAARLVREIAPVPPTALRHDPFARHLGERLLSRAPVLSGNITAATAAVAADGAAFCLVASARAAERLAHAPGAMRIAVGPWAALGGNPELPGLAPVAAIERVLGRARIAAADLAVAEIMEAYAAQAIACAQGAGLPAGIVNRGGGALARGHPVGASGAILAVRLCAELAASPAGASGLAAIAAAGGLGSALILTRDR